MPLTINQLDTSAPELLTPIDTEGARIVRGLHANILIEKLNELIAEYTSPITFDRFIVSFIALRHYSSSSGTATRYVMPCVVPL